MMKNYKNLGILTLILLFALAFAIYKVNALILKQIDQAGVLPPLTVKAPPVPANEEKPAAVIEGIIVEGPPPAAAAEKPLSVSNGKQNPKEVVYEKSIDDPVLIQ
jgi:hypothetical protein